MAAIRRTLESAGVGSSMPSGAGPGYLKRVRQARYYVTRGDSMILIFCPYLR
jgi:hypothetical protein